MRFQMKNCCHLLMTATCASAERCSYFLSTAIVALALYDNYSPGIQISFYSYRNTKISRNLRSDFKCENITVALNPTRLPSTTETVSRKESWSGKAGAGRKERRPIRSVPFEDVRELRHQRKIGLRRESWLHRMLLTWLHD